MRNTESECNILYYPIFVQRTRFMTHIFFARMPSMACRARIDAMCGRNIPSIRLFILLIAQTKDVCFGRGSVYRIMALRFLTWRLITCRKILWYFNEVTEVQRYQPQRKFSCTRTAPPHLLSPFWCSASSCATCVLYVSFGFRLRNNQSKYSKIINNYDWLMTNI